MMDSSKIDWKHPVGWRTALDDWQKGFPATLADLLRCESPPAFVCDALANFLMGIGPLPETQGKGRSKFAPSAKAMAVTEWLQFESILAAMRTDATELADTHGLEPSEVLSKAAVDRAAAMTYFADKHGITTATLEAEVKARRRTRRETKRV